MSLHRSLKTKSGALNQHRNVLTRPERIAFLSERDLFDEEAKSPLGLVKVGSRKAKVVKKKAAEGEGAEAGADVAVGAAPAAPAAGAKPTAGAKPAAGAKAAAAKPAAGAKK